MKKSFILLPCFFLLLAACKNGKEDESAKQDSASKKASGNAASLTAAQYQTADIKTDSIRSTSLSAIIKVNGTIDVPPENMVSVSVPLGGYIRSTHLLPGIHVSKGEVIATVEDVQYIQMQQDYLTTKSQLGYDELEYQRQKELNKSKAASDKIFQQAEAKYNNSMVVLSALNQKLRLININPDKLTAATITKTINIYSPISGFVSKVNVNIGKYVNPTDVLFEIINPSDIHLSLIVYEKDIEKLSAGQELFAYTNNLPGKKYRCKIILISKDLSPERTVEVHCHFIDGDNTLLPGMYMNADIKTNNRKVYALPEEAVVNYEGKEYVFVDSGAHKYQMANVLTGITENHLTEIKNADSLLQKPIVIKGAYTLLMKMKNTGEDEE